VKPFETINFVKKDNVKLSSVIRTSSNPIQVIFIFQEIRPRMQPK